MKHVWDTVEQVCIEPEFAWEERNITLHGHIHGLAPTVEAAHICAEIGWLIMLAQVSDLPLRDL